MNGRLDFGALNASLLPILPALAASWLPGGRLEGREWTALNPMRGDNRPGSFRVNVEPGRWADFATGEGGGDPVSLYAYLFTAGRQGEAARELDNGENRVSRPPAAKVAKAAKANGAPDRDEARRIERARAIWRTAGPIQGTAAERYLAGRGLRPSAAWDGLRSATLSYPGASACPALVSPVRALSGGLEGIQRTYLTPAGGKLAVETPKLSLGRVRGGAIRLGEPAGELILCEGLEDGLSLAQELTAACVWAAPGAGMLQAMRLPSDVHSVIIAADNDAAGEAAARRAGEAFAREGRRVRIMRPEARFKDWNDQLRGAAR